MDDSPAFLRADGRASVEDIRRRPSYTGRSPSERGRRGRDDEKMPIRVAWGDLVYSRETALGPSTNQSFARKRPKNGCTAFSGNAARYDSDDVTRIVDPAS